MDEELTQPEPSATGMAPHTGIAEIDRALDTLAGIDAAPLADRPHLIQDVVDTLGEVLRAPVGSVQIPIPGMAQSRPGE